MISCSDYWNNRRRCQVRIFASPRPTRGEGAIVPWRGVVEPRRHPIFGARGPGKGKGSGVTAYIRKPYSAEQLAKKLRILARIVALKQPTH